MAINLPDPGNGIPEDKTGNDEWTNMKIVRENFRDPNNAASRLVGKGSGNVMEVGAFGLGRNTGSNGFWVESTDLTKNNGVHSKGVSDLAYKSWYPQGFIGTRTCHLGFGVSTYPAGLICQRHGKLAFYMVSGSDSLITQDDIHAIYNTGNTTVDSNQNIKTSSHVLRVFKDKFEAVHEAKELDIKFTRNDVGEYTIEGTTGLRENDWQIVIPEDEHKNQLVAATLDEDENGTIRLKTYKRVFSLETFTFGPDLETPMDIPDGRWIDLHFNDLPQDEVIEDGPAI